MRHTKKKKKIALISELLEDSAVLSNPANAILSYENCSRVSTLHQKKKKMIIESPKTQQTNMTCNFLILTFDTDWVRSICIHNWPCLISIYGN